MPASGARSPAARSAASRRPRGNRDDADIEDSAARHALPAGRRDRGEARRVHLRYAAREPHRHRARLREILRLHHLPRGPARRLRCARAGRGEGRRHAGQGLGTGSDLAALLPGESHRRGPHHRDPEIHDQLRARRWRKEMKWTDTRDIAIALLEKFPDIDPKSVRFTDLHKWVMSLEGFSDDPNRSGEKILEAIQMTWIEEAE